MTEARRALTHGAASAAEADASADATASTLVEKQSSAQHAALADDVESVVDGAKVLSTAMDCCFKALGLFTHNRAHLLEAGLYDSLWQAVCCAPDERGPAKRRSGSALAGVALARSSILLAHSAYVLPNKQARGKHALGPECFCQVLVDLLGQQAYAAPRLSASQSAAIAALHAQHKAFRILPPAFVHSPQAVLLAAARLALEPPLLAEAIKAAAQPSGVLEEVARRLADNVAVLTGRAAPTFTSRTTPCLWYANVSLSVLERLTSAHAVNCGALVALRLRFGVGRQAMLPRVLLAVLPLAQSSDLMRNKAARLCVGSALHLLMNLTHAAAHGRAVLQCAGLQALATLLASLARCTPAASCVGHAAEADVLPESEDLLATAVVMPARSQATDGAGAARLAEGSTAGNNDAMPVLDAVALAEEHLEHVTSAICALSNLCEHDAAVARRLAVLRFSGGGFLAPTAARAGSSTAPASPESSPLKRVRPAGHVAAPALQDQNGGAPDNGAVRAGAALTNQLPNRPRLAVGSRRRARAIPAADAATAVADAAAAHSPVRCRGAGGKVADASDQSDEEAPAPASQQSQQSQQSLSGQGAACRLASGSRRRAPGVKAASLATTRCQAFVVPSNDGNDHSLGAAGVDDARYAVSPGAQSTSFPTAKAPKGVRASAQLNADALRPAGQSSACLMAAGEPGPKVASAQVDVEAQETSKEMAALVCQDDLRGCFLDFLCRSMRCAWSSSAVGGARSRPATVARILEVNAGEPPAESPDVEQDHGQSHLQLYMSILLGILIAATPELRALVANAVDTQRVAHEMKAGVSFYARHGAIEVSSEAVLRSVIARLEGADTLVVL